MGYLGFGDTYRASFEGSVAYLLTNRLLVAYEVRQKSSPYGEIPGLIGDEDAWQAIDFVLLLNNHTTLAAAWTPLGTLANTDENGGWFLQLKHEFNEPRPGIETEGRGAGCAARRGRHGRLYGGSTPAPVPDRFARGIRLLPSRARVSNIPRPTPLPVTATRRAWMIWPILMPSASTNSCSSPLQRRGVERLDLGQLVAELARAARPRRPACGSACRRPFRRRASSSSGVKKSAKSRMSPATLIRSPAAATSGLDPGLDRRRRPARRQAGLLQERQHHGRPSRSGGSSCMWRSWNACSFTGSKLAGALFTRSSEKCSIKSPRWKCSVLSSSDQPSRAR